MDREDLRVSEESGALYGSRPEKGEITRKHFKLGRLQRQILGYVLQSGLRIFKPSMIPIPNNKEVAEALARLMKHGIVKRLSHGYYAANLDKIREISLRKRLEFPPVSRREFPPIRGLAPAAARPGKSSHPARRVSSLAGQQARRAPTAPTGSQQPTAAPTARAPTPAQQVQPTCSVVCMDRKLSRYACNGSKIGVVIPGDPLMEILYDNVRGLTPAGYVHGDRGRLLRAEDLARFDSITYAELTVPSYSDYFELWGAVKIYYKCTVVNGYGFTCSDFVEWTPPAGYIERHGIARANYAFRHYVLPAALKVLHRARQVLARRYHHHCN